MASDEVVRSRLTGLLAQPIDDEVVVYDADTEAAHVLNPLAAAIWQRAQGGATIAELAELSPDGGEAAVRLALIDLESAGLLAETPDATEVRGMSRRTLLKRMGIAAIAVPFVTTIATASPAAAAVGSPCGASLPACAGTEICINGFCYKRCNGTSDCSGGANGVCRCNGGSGSNKYCLTVPGGAVCT